MTFKQFLQLNEWFTFEIDKSKEYEQQLDSINLSDNFEAGLQVEKHYSRLVNLLKHLEFSKKSIPSASYIKEKQFLLKMMNKLIKINKDNELRIKTIPHNLI